MKIHIYSSFLLCLLLQIYCDNTIEASAVTYELGDRLGDNLVSYCHAKWISYVYGIPLRYTPFKYSEYLMLSKIHKKRDKNEFKNVVNYPGFLKRKIDISSLNIHKDSQSLYVIPYFPETRRDALVSGFTYFDINWKDEEFLKQLREEIKPINQIPQLQLPKDVITVCVHLRKGSGPDGILFKNSNSPMRFPPDSYYIEQIKRVSHHFKNKPLYVHIFTDHKAPAQLVQKYKAAINLPNITYNCCVMDSGPDLVVLEDFFNMTLFDCIIRPESHFSIMAAELSHAKLIIYPTDFKMKKKRKNKEREWIITKVGTDIRN